MCIKASLYSIFIATATSGSVFTRQSASEVVFLFKSRSAMKTLFVLLLTLIISLKSVQLKPIENEPRLFFRQLIDASGLFPLEINVPDTISTMMSGISSAYDAMSMYFGNGGIGGDSGTSSQSQSEVNAIKSNGRRKKVKRKTKIDFRNFLAMYYLL